VDEDRRRRGVTARFEQVESTNRVDIEILKWPVCGEIMTGLSRSVDHQLRLGLFDQLSNTVSVADVELAMRELVTVAFQPLLIPTRITGRAEKLGPHVVVNADDTPALAIEVGNYLGPDEPV